MIPLVYITTLALLVGAFPALAQENQKDLNRNGTKDLYEDSDVSLEKRVSDLVPRLTLEQKVNLVVGTGMQFSRAPNARPEKVPGAAGGTIEVESLGIPSIVLADGPAGLRIQPIRDSASTKTFYCTAFPIETQIASAWDTELVQLVGKTMGAEAKEYGVDILLGPAMNIHRNPLTGRNFEYYSEDPYLSGHLAAAMVNGVESNGVGTSVKHFVANNQETNRMVLSTVVSERALREIYLRGFEIVVKESQPWAIMSSYNKLNGPFTSQNGELLNTVLREEWGFEGLVMTDWFGGEDPVAQMQAGNDLLMPGTPEQIQTIIESVKNGKLDENILDQNVKRILSLVLRTLTMQGYLYSEQPDLESHATIARKAAADGNVLLKNENILPLTGSEKLAAFGNTSYDFIAGGAGSGDVNEAYTVSLVEGLENANKPVNTELRNLYQQFIAQEKARQPQKQFWFELLPQIPEMHVDRELIGSIARQSEIALITIGRNSGEFQDRKEEDDFYLNGAEKGLIKDVSDIYHAQGKKVVVILNVGSVIETASWRDQVDAILLAWQGGQEGGNAAADILLGRVNPSGKLPTTFPISYADVPSAKNFPGKELPGATEQRMGRFSRGTPSEVLYEEGIYIGYRYYSTFGIETSYPFGYGLSYTEFTYQDLILSSDTFDGSLTATIEITNSGKSAGREVVQLYISAPSRELDKPALELKGFGKTRLLQPGEKQLLEFSINPRDLASFDSKSSSWVAEAGKYAIKIGASSMDIRVEAGFNLEKSLTVEKTNRVLIPNREIHEMKAKLL